MNTASQPFKIFLVDDDPYFTGLLQQQLEGLGFKDISSFVKSADCLDQLTQKPDLVFLDFNMDNLNGIDILKKIKRFNPDQLVVFVSGQQKIDIAVNALKYGAFDYIIKEDISEARLKVVLEKVRHFQELLSKQQKRSRIKKLLSNIGLASTVLLIQKIFTR